MPKCHRPFSHLRHETTKGTCPGRPFVATSASLHVAALRTLVSRT